MNLLNRLRNAAARFLYGRCGVDQLGWTTLGLSVALDLIAALSRSTGGRALFHALSTALLVLTVYRMLSRNLTARRAENARFLYWFDPRRSALRGWYERRRDRAHKYVRCGCGAWCRVPRGVGKIELMCPKCGERTIIKT